jgi:hypothetical protein
MEIPSSHISTGMDIQNLSITFPNWKFSPSNQKKKEVENKKGISENKQKHLILTQLFLDC